MPRRFAYLLLAAIAALCLKPTLAFAACTNPNGPEGEFFYNIDFHVMQFCDGTNWVGMSGGASGGGGGSLSDGDKGDVVVSGSGTTWSVDNAAISYAKIQNVSAANKILGRATTGAGIVEEITLGSGLTLTGSILSASGSSSGTAGYIQFSGGSGAFASSSITAGQQFFWDETNHRLGIGIAAPLQALDVVGKMTGNSLILKAVGGALAPTGGSGVWTTDGTNVWRATGNVGIGTTNPPARLGIVTNDAIGLVLQVTNNNQTANLFEARHANSSLISRLYDNQDAGIFEVGYAGMANAKAIINGGVGGGGAYVQLNFAGTTKVQVHSAGTSYFNGGNVGIGTASPDGLFTANTGGTYQPSFVVSNPGGATLQLSNYITTTGTTSRQILSAVQGLVGSSAYSNYQGMLAFLTTPSAGTPTERMRIDASGNVGIGTTNPQAGLHVATLGTAWTALNTPYGYHNQSSYGQATANIGSFQLAIYTPGRVVVGEMDATSDRRKKKDITDISAQDAMAFIAKARPVRFTWKDRSTKENFGFIAQDVVNRAGLIGGSNS